MVAGERRLTGQAWKVVAAAVAIGAIWVAALPRIIPNRRGYGDVGTFISVADAMDNGARLYVDIWDNKDPLFYYALALARAISPYAMIPLEFCWLVVAAVSAGMIVRSLGGSTRRAVFVGGALTMIVVAGQAYHPGYTHLPGTAVSLVAVAVALRRRWAAAGALVAVVALLKITTAPVAFTMVVVIALVLGEVRRLWRAVVSGAVTVAAVVAVLAIRGELGGYLQTVLANVGYSGALVSPGWGSFLDHLRRVFPSSGSGRGLVTLAVTVGLLLIMVREVRSPRILMRASYLAAVAGTIACVVVLGLTGQWVHHVQVLYLPAVVAVAITAAVLRPTVSVRQAMVAGAALLAVAVAAGGVVMPTAYRTAWRDLPTNVTQLGGRSPEAAALMGLAPTGVYARLGDNDPSAHNRGLIGWRLGCRYFAQYPFDPPRTFTAVVRCLPSVDAVVVDRGMTRDHRYPAWNRFLAEESTVLRTDFTCSTTSFGKLCVHRQGAGPFDDSGPVG